MKASLLLQLALAILLTAFAAIMAVAAFVKEAPGIWKAFTIAFFMIGVSFIYGIYRELHNDEI